MFVVERHREIISRINRGGSARVTELAQFFQVTEETIRRDLEKLESEGKVLRSHGGAVSVKASESETPFSERAVSEVAAKVAIARLAVKRVEPGDTIFIDASTTAWQMARLLPDMPLTVVTNAIKVAVELATRPNIRVISTGGALASASLSFLGPLAEKILADYHMNKLFFSCGGIDLKDGLSDSNEQVAALKRRMISSSERRYLLADHSKFGVKTLTTFAQLSELHEIVTDKEVSASILKKLSRIGMRVQVA